MDEERLKNEYRYFLKNEKALLAKYPEKYVIIHNQEVTDALDDESEAIKLGVEKYGYGYFLVQKCTSNKEIPQFYGRVSFEAYESIRV